jgi:hypothetical protein
MIVYQWAFYYFIGSTYGTRRTKYGPLFTQFEEAKNHLNLVKIQYSSSFHVGFIYEYSLDDFCYGNIIYKTNEDVPIDHQDCHTNIIHEPVSR